MNELRLLVIDDHAMFRAGLRMVLRSGFPHIDVYESGAILDALQEVATAPDVILLDIRLPGLNGMEGIALLKRKWPQAPILMLSAQDDARIVDQALRQGAAGFVSKAQPADAIITAVHRLARGDTAASALPRTPPECGLTPRQFEVLDLLGRGLPNKVIARKLILSENTVRSHVQAILGHLDAASRSEAVFEARRRGLIS